MSPLIWGTRVSSVDLYAAAPAVLFPSCSNCLIILLCYGATGATWRSGHSTTGACHCVFSVPWLKFIDIESPSAFLRHAGCWSAVLLWAPDNCVLLLPKLCITEARGCLWSRGRCPSHWIFSASHQWTHKHSVCGSHVSSTAELNYAL